MSANCCSPGGDTAPVDPRFRRALWLALAVNLSMFAVEIAASALSGSVSLLADAVDFLGDAANYVISLVVLSMGMLWRARAAWLKGMTMSAFGLAVLAKAGWSLWLGVPPEPLTMGMVGALALVSNLSVALLLYRFRSGDADMRSVWLCSRNDAIGNLAVMLAAVGVFQSGQGWPDIAVAVLMGTLALTSGISIIQHAHRDISNGRTTVPVAIDPCA